MNNPLRIEVLAIMTILSFALITPTIAYAAPLANSDKDWQYGNGNSWAWNYSPQTQINKDNVQNLEVKWIFPIGSKALAPAGIQAASLIEGVLTPPIVKDGIVYVRTNFMRTYAVDAKTGKEVWTHDYNIDADTVQKRIPLKIASPHLHAIRYWEGGDAILGGGLACDFYGLDAKTGKEKLWIKDLCVNVPGSIYKYSATGAGASLTSIATYEKGRQFIFVLPHEDSLGWISGGRAHMLGVDMNTNQILWRVFNQPPQDKATPDWALQECNIGWFRDIPCSEVAEKARDNLMYDAQPVPGQPPHPAAGATQSWMQPVVDEDTGVLYISTGNQLPWFNISVTPGPRLYGSTIMAIDMKAGKRIWWQQPMPRDPYDYDCNLSGVFVDHPTLGKVFVKGCKEGIIYVMDAKTGKVKYKVDIMEEQYPKKKTYHLTDPFDRYDMREWGWPENSRYHGAPPVYLVPSFGHGAFGSDFTYDPESDTLYTYAVLMSSRLDQTLPLVEGQPLSAKGVWRIIPNNVTIVARDLATGKMKWTAFYPYSYQRAHMAVSGGMVFSAFTDGYMRFYDKDTGKPLHEINIGMPNYVGVTIGKDSAGNSKIFVQGGTGRGWGGALGETPQTQPGPLIALGLSEKAAEAKTVTTTTTTTAVGMPAEVTYAAIAIAVVAIVAAAIVTTRRRPSQK